MRAGIVVLLGVAWAAVVLIGIWLSFESGEGPGWVSGDGMKYFMPGLTALIGGVVATAFGVAQTSNAPSATVRLTNLVQAANLDTDVTHSARIWIGRRHGAAWCCQLRPRSSTRPEPATAGDRFGAK